LVVILIGADISEKWKDGRELPAALSTYCLVAACRVYVGSAFNIKSPVIVPPDLRRYSLRDTLPLPTAELNLDTFII